MDIDSAIDSFRAEQMRMIEAFADELRRRYEQTQKTKRHKKQLRNVYVLKREGNTYSVRLQHRYGGKYLRGNISTNDEAQRDAKYLDDAIEEVKAAAVREYLLSNEAAIA